MKMVRSTHTIITLIIAGILSVLFMVGYTNLINPNEKQALKYDQQREDDFEKLKTAIQGYHTKKSKLPETLEDLQEEYERNSDDKDSLDSLGGLLSYQSIPQRDPYSNRPYTLKVENSSSTKYQLCTKFFKENKGDDEAVDKGSSKSIKHGSGEQCIDGEVKKKASTKSFTPSMYQYNSRSNSGLSDEEEQQMLDELEQKLNKSTSGGESTYN